MIVLVRLMQGGLLVICAAAIYVHHHRNGCRCERDPAPHEHLLRENDLVEIGSGARRVCYRIGETGFCVKFLRDPATDRSGRAFGWRFRKSLRTDRFDRARNINCREADAMKVYRLKGGTAVAAALPEVVETVYDPQLGYGVLMSYLTNADGSPVISAVYEMANRRDSAFSRACYGQIKRLLEDLVACSAPFFEPDNFQAQVMPDGGVRIRMIDFEPCDKKLIPLGEFVPLARRIHLRHKARRSLKKMAAYFGISEVRRS